MDYNLCTSIQATNSYLLTTGKFSDVTFITGENKEEIKAHKLILMSRSPVFEAMFQRWETEFNCQIKIPHINVNDFKIFLNFLYTNDVMVSENDVESILFLSHKYNTLALENICSNFILSRISNLNALHILELARTINHREMLTHSLTFIFTNGKEVFEGPEFLNMNLKTLSDLLRNDGLIMEEIDVFKSVIRWGENACNITNEDCSSENIRKMIQNIIPLIRFPLMKVEEFAEQVVTQNRGILSDEETIQLFIYFNSGHVFKSQHVLPNNVLSFSTNPRYEKFEYHVLLYMLAHSGIPRNISPIYQQIICFSVNKDINLTGFKLFHTQHHLIIETNGHGRDRLRKRISDSICIRIENLIHQQLYVDQIDYKKFIQNLSPKIIIKEQIKIIKNEVYTIKISIGRHTSLGFGSHISNHINVVCGNEAVVFNFGHTPNSTYGILKGICFKLL